MFRPGETICVSPNKYGYHSIPLENVLAGNITLVSPDSSRPIEKIESSQVTLVCLNPCKGFRLDRNCTAYRNFLIEMDNANLAQQKEYIDSLGMPYSACIFSGSKSLHYLISLDEDLPNESIYRTISEWILKIAAAADQVTKNPTRSIRLAGSIRPETNKKQVLVDFKGPVPIKLLSCWLAKYPECKPKKPEKKSISEGPYDLSKLKPWVFYRLNSLKNGQLDPTKSRNQQWFAISVEMVLAGIPTDEIEDILRDFFAEQFDFKLKEWSSTIQSGIKYALSKYGS
jgi:hypothetical protein